MKHTEKQWDLRSAFPPVPEDVERMVLQTANSVTAPVAHSRKPHSRISLLVLALLVASASIAMAADFRWGWIEYLAEYYHIQTPPSMQDRMNLEQPIRLEVGPLTFEIQQLIADTHIALQSVRITTTDGSLALYDNDGLGKNAPTWVDEADLSTVSTLGDVAQQLGLPLYQVRATLEPAETYSGGEVMEDMVLEDRNLVYFSHAALQNVDDLNTMDCGIYLSVMELDPATMEVRQRWTRQETLRLSINAPLEQKVYRPVESSPTATLHLEDVQAERTVNGAYLTITFILPEGTTERDFWDNAYTDISVESMAGVPYSNGVSLSGKAHLDALPTVVVEQMFSIDTLPEQMVLVIGGERFAVAEQ